jgi:hypothetical protein
MPRVEQNPTRWAERNLQCIDECVQDKMAGGSTNLTNRQDVIDIQTLEQWPHREVDVHQSSTKVEPTGEPSNNLKACLGPVALGGSI